jgi:hypothetical protein
MRTSILSSCTRMSARVQGLPRLCARQAANRHSRTNRRAMEYELTAGSGLGGRSARCPAVDPTPPRVPPDRRATRPADGDRRPGPPSRSGLSGRMLRPRLGWASTEGGTPERWRYWCAPLRRLSAICQHTCLAMPCAAGRRLHPVVRMSWDDVVRRMVLESCVWGPHSLHTAEVTGSIPVTPTSTNNLPHPPLDACCQQITVSGKRHTPGASG